MVENTVIAGAIIGIVVLAIIALFMSGYGEMILDFFINNVMNNIIKVFSTS